MLLIPPEVSWRACQANTKNACLYSAGPASPQSTTDWTRSEALTDCTAAANNLVGVQGDALAWGLCPKMLYTGSLKHIFFL